MWFTIRRRTQNESDPSDRRRASFASLIKRRKFDKVISVLRDETSDVTAWLDKYGLVEGSKLGNDRFQLFMAQLPLHTALHFQSPVELVDLLIGRLAQHAAAGPAGVVSSQNMLGQSPLHVAVMHGSDISVIERLLQDMSPTVLPSDIWGRTPLHWVVANDSAANVGCFKSTPSNPIGELESKVKIITAIASVFPSSLLIRDKEGFTALELGISHESDVALLYVLAQESHRTAYQKKDLTVCNQQSESDSKACSRQQSFDTPDTSLSLLSNVDPDIPLEIIEMTDSSLLSDDDASSVGTGGMSRYYPCPQTWQRTTRRQSLHYERVKL